MASFERFVALVAGIITIVNALFAINFQIEVIDIHVNIPSIDMPNIDPNLIYNQYVTFIILEATISYFFGYGIGKSKNTITEGEYIFLIPSLFLMPFLILTSAITTIFNIHIFLFSGELSLIDYFPFFLVYCLCFALLVVFEHVYLDREADELGSFSVSLHGFIYLFVIVYFFFNVS